MGGQPLLINFLILVATVIAIITFVLTNLWNAYKMKKRYLPLPPDGDDCRLSSEAQKCMMKRKEAEKFIDRLNGNKFLILGNHDKNIHNSTRFSQITQIKDFSFKRKNIDIKIALCLYIEED